MDIEQTIFDIYEAKQNVKSALAATSEWRKAAAEDFAFMQGKQWQDGDLKKMREAGRPAITINRIRPVINLLCGYASQNETEPDFLPRSEEDDRISRVAKGITKYCLDRANYQRNKGKCFRDKIICGLANYWVSYEFDYTKLDGTIQIERVSPFDAFIDPECKKDDLSDAQYVGRYSWESSAKLKQVYPDKINEIDALKHKYDDTEQEAGIVETVDGEALWYNNNYNKIRVVQYWYKEYGKKNVYMTKEGLIDEDNPLFVVLMATGKKPTSIPDTKIRYATFADNVLLEEGESPYKHGKFPLVREYCYYTGELIDDELEPAGVVRDIKDAQRELNKNNALGIDLGIDNLCTCVTNNGASFIIDGRKLKSINQYYNKINAKLQSIKDKQKIEHITLRQKRIARKRNNRINDYLSKAARIIVNYCLNNDIGKLVLGYNEDFQRNSNIGSINNQNFVNIPYGKLRDKLIYLCKLYGIEFKLQEESYTSKASFFDGDEIPIYDKENQKEYIFSGKRIKRGLYQTSKGYQLNADCNGALNILRKSKVVDLSVLYNRGELNTPKRIRVV